MSPVLLPFAPMLVAAGLGAIIGLERQWHQGMAGLRTNALVATAAGAFVHLPLAAATQDVQPASLAGSVISGIGFLGAGSSCARHERPGPQHGRDALGLGGGRRLRRGRHKHGGG